MEEIRIIYADDHVAWRKNIVEVLKPFNITTVAEANNGKELLEQLRLRPHIVLLDLQMPVMDGNEALDRILVRYPDVKVIVISFFNEKFLINDYKQRGAWGYLEKSECADFPSLAAIIRGVFNGEKYFQETSTPRKKFTTSQEKIIPLIVEGHSNGQIASIMGVRERTIEKHKHNLYERVGGGRSIDFFKYAFSSGLQFLKRTGYVSDRKDG